MMIQPLLLYTMTQVGVGEGEGEGESEGEGGGEWMRGRSSYPHMGSTTKCSTLS